LPQEPVAWAGGEGHMDFRRLEGRWRGLRRSSMDDTARNLDSPQPSGKAFPVPYPTIAGES
ncbi:hypothetical protein, partial [uncultured Methylobacterium sp.]|uniref:hypothetical protein n=1 Tax=uncultured Methylobacterium sp. TaxID=157278 RepID=UPI0035C97291